MSRTFVNGVAGTNSADLFAAWLAAGEQAVVSHESPHGDEPPCYAYQPR